MILSHTSTRRWSLVFGLVALLVAPTIAWPQEESVNLENKVANPQATLEMAESLDQKIQAPIDAEHVAAASSWVSGLGLTEWMGPLAPIALSPFFGVTMMSGLALWGPEWVTNNPILGRGGPLANPTLFWALLALTVITSLPRLTKVSKPFVQAVDRVETYAVIIILLLVKMLATDSVTAESTLAPPVAVIQFGVVSFTAETLLAIAMVINILVINSVKFFFEFLCWLTPVPFLDAVFEVCNKSLCVALMAMYAFSPTLATGINLVMLLTAAIMLKWIFRRVRFYRTMILDPILSKVWTGFGKPQRSELIVFPVADFGPYKAKTRLILRSTESDEKGWVLSDATWWRGGTSHTLDSMHQLIVQRGWVMHSINVTDDAAVQHELRFSRRYDAATLDTLLKDLRMSPAVESSAPQSHQVEFA
jgi:hypothetical protein